MQEILDLIFSKKYTLSDISKKINRSTKYVQNIAKKSLTDTEFSNMLDNSNTLLRAKLSKSKSVEQIQMLKAKGKPKCLNCEKPALVKYCSIQCQKDYDFKIRYENWISESNISLDVKALKRCVVHRDTYTCSGCNISEWNLKPIVLELEHKDGNSLNNSPNNLCLLCPNCHSQTSTFKARNVGNGRHYRRIRYKENKSF